MPKKSQRVEVNNFIRGLITEASPLNFPDNASLSEENFELNRDGTRDRRLGIGFEPGYALRSAPIAFTSFDPSNAVSYKWIAVGGDASRNFLVVQSNKFVDFFDLGADDISNTGYKGRATITSFPDNTKFSFTSAEGRLVIAAGYESIAIVEYNGTAFTVSYDTIKVRDVWGVEETNIPAYEDDITFRSTSAPAEHIYNLYNQSWGIPRKDSGGTLTDPATIYYNSMSVYPSNSEMVWPGLQFQPVSGGTTPYERIFPNLYTEVLGAGEKASKGYFIIDLLKRGTSRVSAFANNKAKYPNLAFGAISVRNDSTSGGAAVVAEFAGRVWYAGFNGQVVDGDKRSPSLSNFAVFSQLVRSRQDFTKCYQDGDPTSREGNDIVDTDGGFVRITGANQIVGMVNLGSSLVILADNGVFAVTGGSDYGFTATNYKSDRISSFGCISSSSIVVEGGRIFFWSEDGIYAVAKDQMGSLGVTNITEKTIQTFYEAIPNITKGNATGVYDPVAKKIRWLYKEGNIFTANSITKELILDTTIGAFYVNRIYNSAANSAEIVGIFASEAFQRGIVDVDVYAGTESVLSSAENVYITETIRQSGIQSARYLVAVSQAGNYYYTIAYYNNTDFRDWQALDGVGVDAKAFLITGEMTGGDSAIAKQVPYLTMHFKRTESGVTAEFVPDKPSGCLIRSQWDWSSSEASKKWSPLFQAYRFRRVQFVEGLDDPFDTGFEVVSSKNKLRGRGDAFSLYMETEPYKDCRILGWRLSVNGNQTE